MNKTPYTPSYTQPLYVVDKHQEGTVVYTDNGVIQQEPVKGEIIEESPSEPQEPPLEPPLDGPGFEHDTEYE